MPENIEAQKNRKSTGEYHWGFQGAENCQKLSMWKIKQVNLEIFQVWNPVNYCEYTEISELFVN